jgi:hypothetical protein
MAGTPSQADSGQNPTYPVIEKKILIPGVYTADPSAHVINGRLVVFCSHDNPNSTQPEDDLGNHFDMIDYRIMRFSEDMAVVEDMGIVLPIAEIPWARRQLWAPDATFVNGRCYFYFPAKDSNGIFRIGVATSPSPYGPFRAEGNHIPGSFSIDPAVFVDDDGQGYLYFGGDMGGQLHLWSNNRYSKHARRKTAGSAMKSRVARLSRDMLGFEGPAMKMIVTDNTGRKLRAGDLDRRFFEGSWVHKYNGTYYFSYSTGETHMIVYATSASPVGPWEYRGVILSPPVGWTTHHSIVEYMNNWYLFYHDAAHSGKTHLRNVKMQRLQYNSDGTIRPMDP